MSENRMSENELKPCPFCGGDALIRRYYPMYSRRSRVIIRCTTCRCNGGEWGRLDKAIEAWNRRVTK